MNALRQISTSNLVSSTTFPTAPPTGNLIGTPYPVRDPILAYPSEYRELGRWTPSLTAPLSGSTYQMMTASPKLDSPSGIPSSVPYQPPPPSSLDAPLPTRNSVGSHLQSGNLELGLASLSCPLPQTPRYIPRQTDSKMILIVC